MLAGLIPQWAIFAFAAAITVTLIPLAQERLKADGYALALWAKIWITLLIAPFALRYGFPDDPEFYLYLGLTAVIYSISDVIYFRAVPQIGSGMVTRLLPSSVVLTFFLWFAIEPALIDTYLAQHWKTAGILIILAAFTFFGMQLRKCPVSMRGIKLIWPVIFAACIGPVLTKLALRHTTPQQAIYAFMLLQSLMMVGCLGGFLIVKKPVARNIVLSARPILTGLLVGIVMCFMLYFKIRALQLVDNPAFVTMVFFTDALWILLVYKVIGRREKGNVIAGLGIVACAALIVLVKSL